MSRKIGAKGGLAISTLGENAYSLARRGRLAKGIFAADTQSATARVCSVGAHRPAFSGAFSRGIGIVVLASLVLATLGITKSPAFASSAPTNATTVVVSGPVVAAAKNPAGPGYWVLTSNGSVYNLGGTGWYGSPMQQFHCPVGIPLSGIAATADGKGYYVLSSNGSVFAYGDAKWAGSPYQSYDGKSPAMVGIATMAGGGYVVLGSNGGVYNFGPTQWYGSPRLDYGTGTMPMVAIASTPDGKGYMVLAAYGNVYSFGDAPSSSAATTPSTYSMGPLGSIAATADGKGYYVLSSTGNVATAGTATSAGSLAGNATSAAVALLLTNGGYRIVQSNGEVFSYPTTAAPPGGIPPAATADPSTNAPLQYSYCVSDSVSCDNLALQGINLARSQEGLGPIMLPFGYESFTQPEQIAAVINAERVARDLPPFVFDQNSLGSYAMVGAQNQTDPLGPANMAWLSIMAARTSNPLVSDYLWMYSDGFGSSNLDCTTATAPGCWGHRRNIISPSNGYMGTAQSADVETAIFQI